MGIPKGLSSDQAEKRQALGGVWLQAQPGLKPPAHLQGPMRQHPSSLRVNCMNLAPNCSSITHLRYGGLGSWLNLPWLPPSIACLPLPTLSLAHPLFPGL